MKFIIVVPSRLPLARLGPNIRFIGVKLIVKTFFVFLEAFKNTKYRNFYPGLSLDNSKYCSLTVVRII